jgi:5'-nucleotidase
LRILCTNDDGINAPGLKAIEEIARALSDDVWVIAPELDQSGVSHSLSLNDPLRLREISPRHYAVRGTPTDCVLMGVYHVLKDKRPDLLLSGVNRGRNVAEDVSYSGTIAGATEGAILGIPSFALSQEIGPASRKQPRWDCATTHGPNVIRKVMAASVPQDTVINVNFPACPAEEVQGIKVARQGRRLHNFLRIEERTDGRGNPYYWIGFSVQGKAEPGEGTDLAMLLDKCVSVTPLRLDRTDDNLVTTLAAALK